MLRYLQQRVNLLPFGLVGKDKDKRCFPETRVEHDEFKINQNWDEPQPRNWFL